MRYAIIVLFATLCLFSSTGCGNKTDAPAPAPAPATAAVTTPAPAPEKTPEEVMENLMQGMDKLESASLAFSAVASMMKDSADKTSGGSAMFAMWGAKSLKFNDVSVSQNETNFRLVQKDSDEARGKRMCVSGVIIQIAVEKTTRGKVTTGLLYDTEGDIYHIIAVGSSGALLAKDHARFCGFVTERYQYQQNGGTTGIGVTLVGMFDLPENRLPSDSISTAPTPNLTSM